MNGYQLCDHLKQEAALSEVPVIFTTGLNDTEDEVRGFAAGAVDYVTKPIQPIALRSRVGTHLELKRMRDQLANLAMTDALTGLGNRRMLEQLLKSELRRLARTSDWLSFLMLDVDCFKQFNDEYGHPMGDQCLQMVATAMQGAAGRSPDVCLRYGGEEFACILPGTDHGGALHVAEAIRTKIKDLAIPNIHSKVGPVVTVSVGVASGHALPDLSMDLWILTADTMLYEAKRGGRDQVVGHIIEAPDEGRSFGETIEPTDSPKETDRSRASGGRW